MLSAQIPSAQKADPMENARNFLESYKTQAQVNYGQWAWVIWQALMSVIMVKENRSKPYEDFMLLNYTLNQILAGKKLHFMSISPCALNSANNGVELKNFLQSVEFFSSLKKAIPTLNSENEEDILAALDRQISLVGKVSVNYPAYALAADLYQLDLAIPNSSAVKQERPANQQQFWPFQRIANLEIYAGKGPLVAPLSSTAPKSTTETAADPNFGFFMELIRNKKISAVVALGLRGMDFPPYFSTKQVYFGEDEFKRKWRIEVAPKERTLANSEIVEEYAPEFTSYARCAITIKMTSLDILQDIEIKNLDIHHISVPDSKPFNLGWKCTKKLFDVLSELLKKEQGFAVHCKAGYNRTGQFIAEFLLGYLKKMAEIFASNDPTENLKKYYEFLVFLRASRSRLLSMPEQFWSAIEQVQELLAKMKLEEGVLKEKAEFQTIEKSRAGKTREPNQLLEPPLDFLAEDKTPIATSFISSAISGLGSMFSFWGSRPSRETSSKSTLTATLNTQLSN